MKPVGQSRGRGIKMVRSVRQLADSPGGFGTPDDSLVVQRYVTNPMMVQVSDEKVTCSRCDAFGGPPLRHKFHNGTIE